MAVRCLRALALAAAGALLGAGCTQDPSPPDVYYRLLDAGAAAAPRARPILDGTVMVTRFHAEGVLAQRPLAWVDGAAPQALQQRHYHFWNAAPPEMLQDLTADVLRARGVAPRVMVAGSGVEAQWRVSGRVRRLEHVVGDAEIVDLLSRPEMGFMPAATVEAWVEARKRQFAERGFSPEIAARAIDIRRRLILALHEAGATLLLGSDAPQVFNVPGYSIHHELAFLVRAGLSPYEALRTGTTAVAEFLGTNTGTVEVGKEADLVLLDANPLEDIRNSRRVHGVMTRGTWHSSVELATRLSRFGPDDN